MSGKGKNLDFIEAEMILRLLFFFLLVDLDDSRQFIEGRRVQEGERVPKHAPIGYCDSKLMNALFSRELASRHQVMSRIFLPSFF